MADIKIIFFTFYSIVVPAVLFNSSHLPVVAGGSVDNIAVINNNNSSHFLLNFGQHVVSGGGGNHSSLLMAPTTTLTFTLAVVLSNPNITDSMMREVLMSVEQKVIDASPPPFLQHAINNNQNPLSLLGRFNYRLQINPVNVNAVGLSRFLKALFCSRSSQGTNALFVLVDKASSGYATQFNNMLTTLAKHINIPMITWSSSVAEDLRINEPKRTGNEEPYSEAILLAPSIRSQARAIYAFLKKFYSDRKVTVIASVKTPGCDAFIAEIRAISEQEDRRHSLFQFDSHQFHMSSRIIQIIKVDDNFMDNLARELGSVRDHTETTAFILFANQADANKILDESHHMGLTASDYIWIAGKPCLGDHSEQTPIPPNYIPGLITVTYNTSLHAQMTALKTAVQIWSESFRKFIQLTKTNAYLHTSDVASGASCFQCYTKIGENLRHLQQQHQKMLAPAITCNNSAIEKWQFGHLLYRAMKHRLAMKLHLNLSAAAAAAAAKDTGITGLSDIVYLDLQFNRSWRRIGGWSASTGAVTIDDQRWLGMLTKHYHPAAKKSGHLVKIVTLEEPPYVIYRFPDRKTGDCDRLKSAPCRLSPLAVSEFYGHAGEHTELDDHIHFSTMADDGRQGNGTLMCCYGFSIDLLRKLSQDIGFNFELFEVRDRKWGAPDKVTGEWNGLVKTLLDGTAEMVVTSLKINSDRNNVIDFSVPFFETGITILVRLREGMVSSVAFLEPFSRETWLVIFFGCVIVFALLVFFFEFLLHRVTILTKDHDESSRYSLVEAFWMILGMLFNTPGTVKQPQSSSTRFLQTIWSFVCLILVASFMANLAAFMITKDDFYDFTGVDDYRLKNPYTKNPAWRYATIPSGATETIIRSNFPDMYEYMRRFTRPNADAGVDAVRKGELDAFIYDASVLEYKVGRDKDCALRTVGKWYALTGYGVAFPKNSKWLNPINKYIVDYQRSGYLQHLEQYWLSSACKERQLSDLQNKSHALGILNLEAVFYVLIMCVVGCAFFLGVEHIFMGYCRFYIRKLDKCRCFALISPKMGAALSFKRTVERAMKSSPQCGRRVIAVNKNVVNNRQQQTASNRTTPSGIFMRPINIPSHIKIISQTNNSFTIKGNNNNIPSVTQEEELLPSFNDNNNSNDSSNNHIIINKSISVGGDGDILLNLR